MPGDDDITREGSTAREWPDFFPVDCPPESALPLNGDVFLLVVADPPMRADLNNAIERGAFLDSPPALRAGVSCARDMVALTERRKRVPRLRSYHLACAAMSSDHGRIQQTLGKGHYTMWLRAKVLPTAHTLFRVIAGAP